MNVIFDMDGLMFDTERVFIEAWDYAGEKIGIGKAGHMVYKTLGMNVVTAYEVWRKEYGERYNQEELRKYTKEFLTNYYNENAVPVKPGLYTLLNYLKKENAKLAVASSSPRWEVEKHLKDAGIFVHSSIGAPFCIQPYICSPRKAFSPRDRANSLHSGRVSPSISTFIFIFLPF